MKFPHKIPVLLKQARKVRKKAKSRAAQGGKKSVRSSPSASSKASPSNFDPQASGGRLEDEKDVATPQDLSGLLDLEAEVDWGGRAARQVTAAPTVKHHVRGKSLPYRAPAGG